jgi:hypothetical protein
MGLSCFTLLSEPRNFPSVFQRFCVKVVESKVKIANIKIYFHYFVVLLLKLFMIRTVTRIAMFLKGPMVDICPIWTVMVISSTIARIMAAYFGSKPSISAILQSVEYLKQ